MLFEAFHAISRHICELIQNVRSIFISHVALSKENFLHDHTDDVFALFLTIELC